LVCIKKRTSTHLQRKENRHFAAASFDMSSGGAAASTRFSSLTLDRSLSINGMQK